MSTRSRRPTARRPAGAAVDTGSAPAFDPEGGNAAMAATMGGSFDTGAGAFDFQQELCSGDPTRPSFAGSAILMQFVAGAPVQGEIGLVQAVQSVRRGAPLTEREGTNDAAITTEDGWRIDSPDSNNPLYGAAGRRSSLASAGECPIELLDETLPDAVATGTDDARAAWMRDHPISGIGGQVDANVSGESQIGSRYERRGEVASVPAILRDAPGVGGWEPGIAPLEQHFETSALVVSGPDQGLWLGSIAWGQRVDDAGRVMAVPARVASHGEPTAAMGGAIDQWNSAETVAGASIDLPRTGGAP